MTNIIDGIVLGGWIPDEADADVPKLEKISEIRTPGFIDLRSKCSPVENQLVNRERQSNAQWRLF